MVLYEIGNSHRQIYTDGRTLPREVNLPAYLGYSVGRWERDTFVVDTAGFNDKQPLDALGHPHSEQLRITERILRRDYGHLDVEMNLHRSGLLHTSLHHSRAAHAAGRSG